MEEMGGIHMIAIRQEKPKDYDAVYNVVKAAFESADHADGNEADLVKALRCGSAFIPGLSLVAEKEGRIAGHILFTKARVGKETVLALAPLSVAPACQRQGIGSALVREGHKRAKALGYAWSVVLGSETYYPRFGYVPAETIGIQPPFDVPSKNFMVCRIGNTTPAPQGVMTYAKEFGIA